MTDKFRVIDHDNDNERTAETKAKAEEMAETAREFGSEHVEIRAPNDNRGDGAPEPDGGNAVVVETPDADPREEPADADTAADLPERSVADDPLDILPSYMIDTVQGTPALNKRGLSVLAFEYGVDVVDREYHALPVETNWESAIVETTVTNEDGKTFVGTGTAHVDRGDDKEVLLELAETRSYKRAVSFATGTGIVAYQELTSEVEE